MRCTHDNNIAAYPSRPRVQGRAQTHTYTHTQRHCLRSQPTNDFRMEVTAARGGINGEPLARADTAGDAGAPTCTGAVSAAEPPMVLRISPSHRRAYNIVMIL